MKTFSLLNFKIMYVRNIILKMFNLCINILYSNNFVFYSRGGEPFWGQVQHFPNRF